MFRLQRIGSYGSVMSKIKTFKRLRDTMGGCFLARRVRNYTIRKWYGGTSVSCQTNAFQEKMFTNLRNKWDSSQEKEGVGAASKPKGNVWASVHDHVRNDPEVLEVFKRGVRTLFIRHLGKNNGQEV